MSEITITEALAEIKTINKRIAKKQDSVLGFLYRQDNLKDPLADQGGSKAFVQQERQAINDLSTRLVAIRSAIQAANSTNTITIGNATRSIADWLVWRRDVVPGYQVFLNKLRNSLANVRSQAQAKGVVVRTADQPATTTFDMVVNLDEKELAAEVEVIEEILGTLDGQLSLKNATVLIDV